MRVSDKAIILQSIKHGDNKLILKVFAQNHGMLTVGLNVGKAAKSKIKSSTVLPLHFIDAEFIIKQNKDIHQLTEATCYRQHVNLYGSIAKLSIAQFLNEVLLKALKEHHVNESLYEFMELCLNYLNDAEEDFANLHLYFLIELSRYLGFEPQNNYSVQNMFFDCREGKFTALSLVNPMGLSESDSKLFSEFLKVNVLTQKLTNQQRQVILEALLAYYRFHVPNFNTLNSVAVLKEVLTPN